MKLIVTADLHYNISRSIQPTQEIAERICGLRADALLILGDVGGRDIGIVRDCLHLFDRFEGRKFFVAGNHDIWTHHGENSLERLEKTLPDLCRQADFHPLDLEPAVIDGVGLVGSIGWYDFSYRPSRLNIPLRFYREKVAPGAASRFKRYQHLLVDRSDIPEEAMRIGTRWMDGQHVRLPMSDLDFCHRLLNRFTGHLNQIADRCQKIIVGMHHIPFRQMVPDNQNPTWAFARTYMGSELFGEAMLVQPNITHAFFAHSHRPLQQQIQHIKCIDVGCTYIAKRYETVEIV